MQRPQELQGRSLAQVCNPLLTLGGRVSQATTLTVLAVEISRAESDRAV